MTVLKTIVKGLAGRLLAYGVFGLGFWVLYRSLFQSSLWTGIPMGVIGGGLILGGMYLIVTARRFTGTPENVGPAAEGDQVEESRGEDQQGSVRREE